MATETAKKRRHWSDEETDLLLKRVIENYSFLTDAVTPNKTRQMIDAKWTEITDEINSLGNDNTTLTDTKVSKKWSDMKSAAKLAVMKYRKEMAKTGGGTNTAKNPTEVQWKIFGILKNTNIEGIEGTQDCDTSTKRRLEDDLPIPTKRICAPSSSSTDVVCISPAIEANVHTTPAKLVPDLDGISIGSPRTPKMSSKKQQLQQNDTLLKMYAELRDEVKNIRLELAGTNQILYGMLEEMRKLIAFHTQTQAGTASLDDLLKFND